MLSGTPFRSDQNPIPFVDYDFDEAVAHYVYGYGEALEDGGVVRPVFFPRLGGHMEWTAPDGSAMSATFDDHLDRTAASQRLRTALSPDGEWLPAVLEQAHTRLQAIREQQPDAAGLVIAMDVDHAKAIAKLLRRHGVDPVVATSDDPLASEYISEFAESRDPWIVAVRMVSEGVDIPRLRVGVYATNTVTELFFRQAVGRLVRWHGRLRRQKAFFFIPDDYRLRTFASQLAEQRTHSLKRRESDGEQPPVELDGVDLGEEDQLSLFQAISATPMGDGPDPDPDSIFDDAHPEDLIHEPGGDDLELEIELVPPPPLAAGGQDGATITVSRTQRKRELRQANADRVQMLVHLTGLDHKVVNARLNEEARIERIAQATVADLERRLAGPTAGSTGSDPATLPSDGPVRAATGMLRRGEGMPMGPLEPVTGHVIDPQHVPDPGLLAEVLPPRGTPSDAQLHRARATLARLVAEHHYRPLEAPCLLVIEIDDGRHRATAVVGDLPITAFDDGTVLPHEQVDAARVATLRRHLEVVGAVSTPVSLAHRDDERLDAIVAELTAGAPHTHLTDGTFRTSLWVVDEEQSCRRLAEAVAATDGWLIADGHHRAAAGHVAGRVLVALTPDSALTTRAFHRRVEITRPASAAVSLLAERGLAVEALAGPMLPASRRRGGPGHRRRLVAGGPAGGGGPGSPRAAGRGARRGPGAGTAGGRAGHGRAPAARGPRRRPVAPARRRDRDRAAASPDARPGAAGRGRRADAAREVDLRRAQAPAGCPGGAP
jgi:hypothetical protein